MTEPVSRKHLFRIGAAALLAMHPATRALITQPAFGVAGYASIVGAMPAVQPIEDIIESVSLVADPLPGLEWVRESA